jgi:hypothetical protein
MATSKRRAVPESGVPSWRSGLEEAVAKQLAKEGIAPRYEQVVVRYERPSEKARYTADFLLPNGIIIETKGWFVTADRKKHKLIKAQHPELDVRFVFSNPQARIGKKSTTTYAKWCDDHGFEWYAKTVPDAWLREPINSAALAAAMEFHK